MGAGESKPSDDIDEYLNGEYNGYHVLKVQDGSPGELAGLVPFFDYIVSINGVRLVCAFVENWLILFSAVSFLVSKSILRVNVDCRYMGKRIFPSSLVETE